MTPQEYDEQVVEEPLYEKVEKLFDLRINNTGNWIGIKFGGSSRSGRVWVEYEVFLKLRKSIEDLVQSEVVKKVAEARIDELNRANNYAEEVLYVDDDHKQGFAASVSYIEARLAVLREEGKSHE